MTNDRVEHGGTGRGRRVLAAKVAVEVLAWLAALALFAFAGRAALAAARADAHAPAHTQATLSEGER
ncbi:MAG TPA: hypothetical protein VEY09_13300 [Pyrinomonadaceae bacterium]|nr:hypothetical protein [Pyrinomonadaceae bacterium]